MKATLLAILTLGSLAMADQALTLAPYAEVGSTGIGNGDSDGIVFTLKGASERTQILNDAVMPATGTTVTLTSIEIANRSGNDSLKNYAAVITDASGHILGWDADPVSSSKSHKPDWELDYTRNYVTYSDFYNPSEFGAPITLTVGEEYHIYFSAGDQQYDLWVESMGEGLMKSGLYTKVGFSTVDGKHDSATARDYGFINGVGAASVNMAQWAPAMGVTIAFSNVPEPTTGTLSLLALAGLCIRRRK